MSIKAKENQAHFTQMSVCYTVRLTVTHHKDDEGSKKQCRNGICDQIHYENMNGLYKMRYSHEMNDE